MILSAAAAAQELPKKIRGYKVHTVEMSAATEDLSPSESGPLVDFRFGDPALSDVGLEGVTFLIPGSIVANGKDGTVDFLTFLDFRVNGIPVEIRDYTAGFRFKSGEEVNLPDPVEITVSITSAIRSAAKEMVGSADEWEVSGRVFIFGKFKKFGFSFKRVVPVDVTFSVPNPLK